jgi:hypothetical protein
MAYILFDMNNYEPNHRDPKDIENSKNARRSYGAAAFKEQKNKKKIAQKSRKRNRKG